MKQIDDITLIKLLGKGSYGEVYLSKKKGRNEYFATKKMGEGKLDKYNTKKDIENEIELLKILRHPNIIGFEGYKMTKDCFYVTMEFANGGSLSDCLKKYQKKYGKAFSEEIIQHLMRQIISALKFIHSKKVIHRDLKLDNIMANFDNENDKNNVNMLRAKVKIIDFGTAIKVGPNNLATTIIGSPLNMDPAILKKYENMISNKAIRDPKQPYDKKVDIWSIGTACYQMLIGKPCFDADTLNELVTKVEQGNYSLPTTISKEMVSFLNAMLQYESDKRLSSEELENHPFLKKRVSDFEKIDIKRVKRKIDNKGLNINVKKNQTIWSIFNEEEEQLFLSLNIYGNLNRSLVDNNNNNYLMRTNTLNPKIRQTQQNIPINKTFGRRNSSNYSQKIGLGGQNSSIYSQNSSIFGQNSTIYGQNSSIYGQNSSIYGQNSSIYGQNSSIYGQNSSIYRQKSPIYGQNIYTTQNRPKMANNAFFQSNQGVNYGFAQNNMNYPTFGVPSQYSYGGYNTPAFSNSVPNIQNRNNNYINNNISHSQSNYRPIDNEEVDDDDKGSGCLIQ